MDLVNAGCMPVELLLNSLELSNCITRIIIVMCCSGGFIIPILAIDMLPAPICLSFSFSLSLSLLAEKKMIT